MNRIYFMTLLTGVLLIPQSGLSSERMEVNEKGAVSTSCPNLEGNYEQVAFSEERANVYGKPFKSWLTGMLFAGSGGVANRWHVNSSGKRLLQDFDYVVLRQTGDTLKISVGYSDEKAPRNTYQIHLQDDARSCVDGALNVHHEYKSRGEGVHGIVRAHIVTRKEQDGSIISIETERHSQSILFIPIGADTQTFTYRFKPYTGALPESLRSDFPSR